MRAILHNIRSVHNVGSIFRTADAIEAEKIYLSGFSPSPLNQFGEIRADFHKTALGAEESVAWERSENVFDLIKGLKEEGFEIVAIEQDKRAGRYSEARLDLEKTVFIFGHEVRGIDGDILDLADQILELPMKGIKNSLNVSVAFGIIAYHFQKYE